MRWQSFLSAVLVSVAVVGCGGAPKPDRPATVKATGVVNYNGKPLAGAIVIFQPAGAGGVAANATTDAEGKFDLQAFPPDSGAVAGNYTVGIMKMEAQTGKMSEDGSDGTTAVVSKSLIPSKYGNPVLSGLKAEIPASGTDTLKFELKD